MVADATQRDRIIDDAHINIRRPNTVTGHRVLRHLVVPRIWLSVSFKALLLSLLIIEIQREETKNGLGLAFMMFGASN